MTRHRLIPVLTGWTILAAAFIALPQGGDFAAVISKPVSRTLDFPGELAPFQNVAVRARVAGYVDRILVDRGSAVRQGDLLAELIAPEIAAQIAAAESKAQSAEADRLQAEAQLAAAQSTYDRMKLAAQTPGAIAGNEVTQWEKQVEAAKALLNSRHLGIQAADAAVRGLKDIQAYLKITAPFDGLVTERLVHPGALVGPGADAVLLILQQVARLRLIVAVPEEHVGGIVRGARVSFSVPAYPGRSYEGTVSRISQVLDQKTRTMPVELDVNNQDGSLAPGMYPKVKWPIQKAHPGLYVPRTSVVTTAERTFVVLNDNGRARWVDVRKGAAEGDLIEVQGDLKAGDLVVRRATDELREGAPLQARPKQ